MTASTPEPHAAAKLIPGQVVLVLQGGGALGAYQAGVYQAMHEAGIEPDWVIGTSIGAINAALIAGNAPDQRLAHLRAFWDSVEQQAPLLAGLPDPFGLAKSMANASTVLNGIPGFFVPNNASWQGAQSKVGVEAAAYYSTAPLAATLDRLVDFANLPKSSTRLTVGAVHVQGGQMRYFDSREERLGVEHVMASGALPPAFPAVRVHGEPYWDGGIYSNTPIEAVMDDRPRRDSLIFAVDVWQPHGPEPQSINEVSARVKDIQFASRADNHIERQKQIHRLRHIIRELTLRLPQAERDLAEVKALSAWGCKSTMHVVRLQVPRVDGEDQSKDIDFSKAGIHARWLAGYDHTQAVLASAPWQAPVDPMDGVTVHHA
ncbi:MAG: patatin-like phospholipase family protein [Burkholderiaceae bacterium]